MIEGNGVNDFLENWSVIRRRRTGSSLVAVLWGGQHNLFLSNDPCPSSSAISRARQIRGRFAAKSILTMNVCSVAEGEGDDVEGVVGFETFGVDVRFAIDAAEKLIPNRNYCSGSRFSGCLPAVSAYEPRPSIRATVPPMMSARVSDETRRRSNRSSYSFLTQPMCSGAPSVPKTILRWWRSPAQKSSL